MIASRAWVKRNLGFDPITSPPPISTFAVTHAAKPKRTIEDMQREIIEFDSEGREGAAFLAVSEVGDAILGLVASQMGAAAPRWVAVRNVFDPQIESEGTITDQGNIAEQIYKGYGRWSSVCSAIVCWAIVAAEE